MLSGCAARKHMKTIGKEIANRVEFIMKEIANLQIVEGNEEIR